MKSKKSHKIRYILLSVLFLIISSVIFLQLKNNPEIVDGHFNIEVPSSNDIESEYKSKDRPVLKIENKMRKEINGSKYIFETISISDDEYRMRFGLYEKENGKFLKEFDDPKKVLTYYVTDDTIDFWFDEPSGVFITINTDGGWQNNDKNKITILRYQFNKENYKLENKEEMYAFQFKDNYRLSAKIFGYIKDQNMILLDRRNTISCFIEGAVYKITTQKAELISEYTNGCKYDHPRFAGLTAGKIIFGMQIKNLISSGTTSTGHIAQIYGIDPVNMNKNIYANFSAKQNLDLINVDLYQDEKTRDNNVVLMNADFYLYNILSETMTKIDSIDDIIDSY